MPRSFVVIRTSFEAIHCWPECPFQYADFLKQRHRHIFHVEMKWETKEDRQVEFIEMKKKVDELLRNCYQYQDLGRRSCETIAFEIASAFEADFVSVFEDGENGAEYHAT